MRKASTIARGAASLGAAQIGSYGLLLIRNILIARAIGPEHFGVAAAFGVTVAFVEMISDLSADRLMVQADDGNSSSLQSAAQAFLASRGVLCAILVLLLGGALARWLRMEEAAWAFRALAILPLLKGFEHLDYKRVHREMRFGATFIVTTAPAFAGAVLAWPLAVWLGDYGCMLWILATQSVVSLVATHVLAQRRYEWGWSSTHMWRMFRFGWPLLMNGLLMFGALQGDRFLVGRSYGPETLGQYAVACAVGLAPSMILGRVASALLLPLLARRKDDAVGFERGHSVAMLVLTGTGALTAGLLLTLGPAVVRYLYGVDFSEAGSFLGWLAVVQAFRIMRIAPTVACLARGDTVGPLLANVLRCGSLVAATVVVFMGAPVVAVVIAAGAGELVATAGALYRLWRRHGVRPGVPALAFSSALTQTKTTGAPS